MSAILKPVIWVGSSREDLKQFPSEVRDAMGYALYLAQIGEKHPDAKPLKGFGGAGVLEVVDDFQGDSYRAVYTVRLARRGIKTTRRDIELIKERYRQAEEINRRLDRETQESHD